MDMGRLTARYTRALEYWQSPEGLPSRTFYGQKNADRYAFCRHYVTTMYTDRSRASDLAHLTAYTAALPRKADRCFSRGRAIAATRHSGPFGDSDDTTVQDDTGEYRQMTLDGEMRNGSMPKPGPVDADPSTGGTADSLPPDPQIELIRLYGRCTRRSRLAKQGMCHCWHPTGIPVQTQNTQVLGRACCYCAPEGLTILVRTHVRPEQMAAEAVKHGPRLFWEYIALQHPSPIILPGQ